MLGRFVATAGALLLALAGWAWPRTQTEATIPRLSQPSAGTYFDAEVSSVETTITLPDDFAGACDLIVSSLADSDQTFQVRLSAKSKPKHGSSRLCEIANLQWPRHPRQFPATGGEITPASPKTPSPTDVPATAAKQRTFHIHVTDTPLEDQRGYTRVHATLVAEGRDVRVYCDEQAKPAEIAGGLTDEIVYLLDERIIPRSREFLGTHRDVDGDGKLAVLLTPWLGRLQGGRTSVNGFVRSSDFQPDGATPYSNRADVLYLNSALHVGHSLSALLSHEYTHAVCCSLRQAGSNRVFALPDEADWLNEAIAHVAERLHEAGWSNLDRRVQSFLASPQQSPLVVRDYYRAGLWRDPGCRGATYLFLQWCADGYGNELLRELVTDPRTGVEKLEAVTGKSFESLFRHWTIALHQGELRSLDLHGQLGGCQLTGPHRHVWNATEGSTVLTLCGTATAFVRCDTRDANHGADSIVIEAPLGARLQVTTVRQSDDARRPAIP